MSNDERTRPPVVRPSRALLLPACLALLALLAAAGCTMAPKYVRPDAPIPNTYGEGASGKSGDLPAWKTYFRDPNMQRVIELALVNNRDLRISMLNIAKTRAMYRIQRADLLPTIAAGGEAANQRLPADVSSSGQAGVFRQYTASLGFSSYELDLFGRVRSLTEQALETFHSVEEDARTAQISLISETAGMYLQLVADRELLDITRDTYKNRKNQYELIRRKLQAEVSSELEVSQTRSLMEEARAQLARYEAQVGQDANYLALLVGAPLPTDLPDVRKLKDIAPLDDLPEGLPSTLLERRPDIRSAEHQLMAANANIGAARAAFFPTITLTGAFGTTSADYDNLFTGPQKAWSFLPQVSLPIFDTGRNVAQLRVSQANRDIAVATYEKTIQAAFREVGDALVQRTYIGDQLDAERSLVESTATSYKLAMARYDVGVDSYLNVLDSQRSLFSAQQNLIGTLLLRESNALTLYKALGGGVQ